MSTTDKTPVDPKSLGDTFLPFLHDMLAMGVPEATASRWHNAIWLLKSHAEHMAEVIEKEYDEKDALLGAAEFFRKAMEMIRPHS